MQEKFAILTSWKEHKQISLNTRRVSSLRENWWREEMKLWSWRETQVQTGKRRKWDFRRFNLQKVFSSWWSTSCQGAARQSGGRDGGRGLWYKSASDQLRQRGGASRHPRRTQAASELPSFPGSVEGGDVCNWTPSLFMNNIRNRFSAPPLSP